METITVITSGQNIQVVSINAAAQGPAGTSPTIANYGDNRILTSDGSSTGINGEGNLTFNGSLLSVVGSGNFSQNLLVNGTAVSISGHTHTVNNITDITSAGSGIVTASSFSAQNKLGWTLLTNTTGVAGGQYYSPKTSISTPGTLTLSDPATASDGDFYIVIKHSGNGFNGGTVIGGVNYSLDSNAYIIRMYNTDSIFPPSASWKSYTLDNYHTHVSANITNFNSSVSGLLPTISNSGNDRILTSTGTNTGINAESNLTFNGSSLVINSGLTTSTGNFTSNITSSLLNIDNIRIDGNTISSTNTNGNLIIQTTGTGAIQRDSGGNSRGQYAIDLQNARNSGTQVAAANYSNILGGSGNQIVSDSIYSNINGGAINTISANGGYNFIGGGYGNTISNLSAGSTSVICGGASNSIQGEYYGDAIIGGGYGNIIEHSNNQQRVPTAATIPGGYEAKATRWGELSHAAGQFTNAGDAQHTILIARKLTTDDTANVILLLDNGISGSYKLELPNKTTWTFEIKLSAYNDTDSAGGGWIFKGAIRSDGSGNTAIIGVGVTAESWLDTAMSGASADVVANDTTNSLDIRVTGLSGKNIRWVAVIDISQVCYGNP